MGEKTSWPDGNQIKIAALSSGDIHSAFVREIVKLNPVQFSALWKEKVFTIFNLVK